MEKDNYVYITYDINLKHYLKECGFEDIVYGMNPNTNRLFWVYKRTKHLNDVLSKWYK